MNRLLDRSARRSVLALALLASSLAAFPARGDFWCGRPLDGRQLSRLSVEQLDELFLGGAVNCLPCGYLPGRPLLMLDYRRPRLRAALSGVAWKGKHFLPGGRMVNQWAGFRAVEATVSVEPSVFDGLPCIKIDYPPNARVFGGTWDEVREIAPGLFLGRFYARCPTPRLQGYFVLESARR